MSPETVKVWEKNYARLPSFRPSPVNVLWPFGYADSCPTTSTRKSARRLRSFTSSNDFPLDSKVMSRSGSLFLIVATMYSEGTDSHMSMYMFIPDRIFGAVFPANVEVQSELLEGGTCANTE